MRLAHQPPFPYYGAKGKLAPWIVSHIPEHKAYVEPFCGSAAVLLAKERCRTEVLNDANGDVVTFWRVLRDQPDALVEVLQRTPYARDEYKASLTSYGGLPELERARRFFVRCCMAFNASTRKVGFSSSAPGRTGKAQTFAARIDTRLMEVAERVRGVEIENVDALRLVDRWRQPDTVLYLDPPYLASTRKSKRDYATESNTDEFHASMLHTVADFPGTVLISGYMGGPYESLGWRCERREVPAHVSNAAGARRVECLWINR
ncbi:DNA adenine methylase [Streptomyces zagrosensis]|uniref:site-specific DNA-methyltransferase (adenine-specific) n=1 Tax=Streptomyces zagrosensis TaxID=1042984 RepID=A0A7W9UY92_9ACTN|nr:DNA adenine methylase [Streptomyces zagrosensis]